MGDVLVVAEAADGHIKKTTHSAVTFARAAATALGGTFSILVLGSSSEGSGLKAAAKEIANLGAAKILVADDPSLKDYLAERYAPTVAKVGGDFQVIVATASSFGKDLLPRAAARLEAGYVGDVTELIVDDGALSYRRPMFAGNAFGVATVATEPELVTVRQSAFAPAEPSGGDSPIEDVAVVAPGKAAARVQLVSFDQVKSERPELGEAKVIVSGGRALKEKFNEIIDPLADVLGAGVGASRAACDAGYCAPDMQVGQTGRIVAPRLYVAIGISGAIQHLAGMKGAKTIVAINKDAEAPIFQVADYGLVADLFTAVPELVTAIKAAKS